MEICERYCLCYDTMASVTPILIILHNLHCSNARASASANRHCSNASASASASASDSGSASGSDSASSITGQH